MFATSPRAPGEAPPWASSLIGSIIDWVEAKLRGPQVMTRYTTADRPSAAQFRRAMTYDGTLNAPIWSDESGAWHAVQESGAAASFTTLSISGGAIIGGTYAPTATIVANLDAFTASTAQYMRVGSVVTVSGYVTVDPTAPAASTQGGISLPIASNFTANEDCCGTAFASGIATQGAAILGDAANDRAQIQWVSGDVTSQRMYYTFTYQVK